MAFLRFVYWEMTIPDDTSSIDDCIRSGNAKVVDIFEFKNERTKDGKLSAEMQRAFDMYVDYRSDPANKWAEIQVVLSD
jgi:hypothetical protein